LCLKILYKGYISLYRLNNTNSTSLTCYVEFGTSTENGKPVEKLGRKAKGPENGSQLPKGGFFMKKALSILLILVFCVSIEVQASYVPVNLPDYNTRVISVTDYYSIGDVDYTDAIIKANSVLKSSGGGTLVFPAGDYKIRPGRIRIPSGVKWLGQGSARIYTQESSLYNIILATEYASQNIVIENLIIDQSKDAAMLPSAASSLGAFILHINSSNNVYVNGCTFYTYGVCAILAQCNYVKQTNVVTVSNNSFYFTRKVDKFYDVSVINLDGRSVYVENNYIEGVDVSGFKYSKPRSAIEVHMPNGSISNNTINNTELGILHLGWPSLWTTYEPLYRGSLQISDNKISKAIIGIDVWSASTLANVVTRNLSIQRNDINLFLGTNSFPAKGISLSDGSISNTRFENILIEGNTIKMEVDPAITNPVLRMNYLMPGNNTGAMSMNVRSTIDNMEISNNTIVNFPYSFLNLYRRNNPGETYKHNNIRIHDNTIYDSSYSFTYLNAYDYSINVGNASNVAINNNKISNPTKKLVGQLNKLPNVTDFEYTNNTFDNETFVIDPVTTPSTTTSEPVVTEEVTAPAVQSKTYVNVIGTWANSKQIYVTNMSQCSIGDIIITPNNEKAKLRWVASNYIFLETDVGSWFGGKEIRCDSPATDPASDPVVTTPVVDPVRSYTGVIGTWANSKQIYVTNMSQCSIGDIILTPNNEKAKVRWVASNYIFLETDVGYWFGGKAIQLSSY